MKGKVLLIIKKLTQKNLWLIGFIFLFTILGSILSLINPLLYSKLIDNIIPSKNYGFLVLYLCLMVLVPCCVTLFSSIKNYLSAKLGDIYTNNLRKECFNKILGAKIDELEKTSTAQIVQRITKESGRIGEIYITKDLITFVSEFVTLLFIMCTMFWVNMKLSIICVVAFPIAMLITHFVSKKSKMVDKALISTLEEGNTYLTQTVNSLKTIKLKNGQDKEKNNWLNWLKKYRSIRLKSSVTHNISNFLMGDLIINSVYGIVFFCAGILVIEGQLTVGELVAFIAFVPKVYSSLRNVLNLKVANSVVSNSVEKINEILTIPQERESGREIDNITSIKFKNVDFMYDRADFMIENMNFDIEKGEKVAFIGSSGSGKSTLFDLITLLYTPIKGSLLLNDINANDLNIKSIRKRIAIVSQSTDIFNDSIKNNILYPDLEENQIEKILQIAKLDDFIDRLTNGMDTLVGERGTLLSGGERQRICIANALLKESDVVLLDEFTSALDVKIEKQLIDYVLKSDKTVMMVSHRIYNAMNFDKIVIMEDGKILEYGDPQELIKDKKSILYELYSKINLNFSEGKR